MLRALISRHILARECPPWYGLNAGASSIFYVYLKVDLQYKLFDLPVDLPQILEDENYLLNFINTLGIAAQGQDAGEEGSQPLLSTNCEHCLSFICKKEKEKIKCSCTLAVLGVAQGQEPTIT
jgi:hypothetical protein